MIGRYIQSDPLGLAAGFNTYSYVGSNPLGAVDPLGLSDILVWSYSEDGKGGSKAMNYAAKDLNGSNLLDRTLYILAHGHPELLEFDKRSPGAVNFQHLWEPGENNIKHVKSASGIKKLIEGSGLNMNDYDNIVIGACKLGEGSIPDELAKLMKKNVYSFKDYIIWGHNRVTLTIAGFYIREDIYYGLWGTSPVETGYNPYKLTPLEKSIRLSKPK